MQKTVFNLVAGKWVKIERFWVSVKKWPNLWILRSDLNKSNTSEQDNEKPKVPPIPKRGFEKDPTGMDFYGIDQYIFIWKVKYSE